MQPTMATAACVVKRGGKYFLQLTEEKAVLGRAKNVEKVDVEVIEEIALKSKVVYLKVHGDFNPRRDMASFSYSLDGEKWNSIGREIAMRFDYTRHFMGSKFAIFNYATKQTGGYVDVDWFHFEEK